MSFQFVGYRARSIGISVTPYHELVHQRADKPLHVFVHGCRNLNHVGFLLDHRRVTPFKLCRDDRFRVFTDTNVTPPADHLNRPPDVFTEKCTGFVRSVIAIIANGLRDLAPCLRGAERSPQVLFARGGEVRDAELTVLSLI